MWSICYCQSRKNTVFETKNFSKKKNFKLLNKGFTWDCEKWSSLLFDVLILWQRQCSVNCGTNFRPRVLILTQKEKLHEFPLFCGLDQGICADIHFLKFPLFYLVIMNMVIQQKSQIWNSYNFFNGQSVKTRSKVLLSIKLSHLCTVKKKLHKLLLKKKVWSMTAS